MKHHDKRIDAYIAECAAFAQPILRRLRRFVHQGCPDVQETIRWGFPHFDYNGMMCSMAAFKKHCTFGFWKSSLMSDPKGLFKRGSAMGNLGRIESVTDLPTDSVFLRYIREAAELNKRGARVLRKKKPARPVRVPTFFAAALNKNKRAGKVFDSFSASQQREYIEWLTEAKTQTTREKRLRTAIAWIAQGKMRNWLYIKK
jgi:hypothetical protein